MSETVNMQLFSHCTAIHFVKFFTDSVNFPFGLLEQKSVSVVIRMIVVVREMNVLQWDEAKKDIVQR